MLEVNEFLVNVDNELNKLIKENDDWHKQHRAKIKTLIQSLKDLRADMKLDRLNKSEKL